MSVPFLDLEGLHGSIRDELDEAFAEVVKTSAFVGGAPVKRFEAAFAAAHGRAFAVGCASGTDALSLALAACGIGAGDDVVVPSMTFFATAEAVTHVGATPIIADVDPDTLLLTERDVDAVMTDCTRAVMPVHLYGHVVPFSALQAWRDAGLVVIEDAAQAHIATWEGQPVGTVGHAACFSFYPGKNLGALGDAGAIVTDDDAIAADMRQRRDHGRTDKYRHDRLGVSSRLDGLQAAFLEVKLRHLADWTAARVRLADRYRVRLRAVRDVDVVPWEPGAVHHLLVVRVRAGRRAELQRALSEQGIGSGVHYPVALSQQPPFVASGPRPAAELAADEVLSLPLDPLLSIEAVDTVCDVIVGAMGT